MTMEKQVAIRQEVGVVPYTPQEVVDNATIQAKLLMSIVTQTGCFQEIAGKKYLQVEAWETIGAFNRTHAETANVTPIIEDGAVIGYRAHVQLWRDGQVVGGAIMPCYFTENCCKGKEGDAKHKASMSAAQTFATSKAYRMNFSFVAILAGYQPLPAEEITEDMKGGDEKSEHWCAKHKTLFFMRGKMKSYAHPIEGAGGWCYEHKLKQSTPEQIAQDMADLGFGPEPGPATETQPAQAQQPVASAPGGGSPAPAKAGGHPGALQPQPSKAVGIGEWENWGQCLSTVENEMRAVKGHFAKWLELAQQLLGKPVMSYSDFQRFGGTMQQAFALAQKVAGTAQKKEVVEI